MACAPQFTEIPPNMTFGNRVVSSVISWDEVTQSAWCPYTKGESGQRQSQTQGNALQGGRQEAVKYLPRVSKVASNLPEGRSGTQNTHNPWKEPTLLTPDLRFVNPTTMRKWSSVALKPPTSWCSVMVALTHTICVFRYSFLKLKIQFSSLKCIMNKTLVFAWGHFKYGKIQGKHVMAEIKA